MKYVVILGDGMADVPSEKLNGKTPLEVAKKPNIDKICRMGEIHYSRVPEECWEDELIKMKSGGVDVISSYVFWIHHEEIEGNIRFDGNLNIKKFLSICKKLSLPFILRLGPWVHGEAKNGGFPD